MSLPSKSVVIKCGKNIIIFIKRRRKLWYTNISDLHRVPSNRKQYLTHSSDTTPSEDSQRSLLEPKNSFNETMSVKTPNMTAYHSQDSNNAKVFYYLELVDCLSTKQLTWRLRAQSSSTKSRQQITKL